MILSPQIKLDSSLLSHVWKLTNMYYTILKHADHRFIYKLIMLKVLNSLGYRFFLFVFSFAS